jgi:phosphohistidine swiveling domain-containing protein
MVLTLHWSQIRKEHLSLLGQKCARLADVKARLGVGVPPFFALTSHFVKRIIDAGGVPVELRPELADRVRELEAETGQIFGGAFDPLLFAVRSGDPISMVGTMTTLLNVGMNDRTLNRLIAKHGHENAASLWRMYLDLHVDMNLKAGHLTREAMRDLLQEMKNKPVDVQRLGELVIKARTYGYVLPQELNLQLTEAVRAVALSWLGSTSQSFVDTFKLDADTYPSIMVQKKEYAAFVDRAYASFSTRNPLTGERVITGDYALGTEGRSMMRGICQARRDIRTIDAHFPGTFDLLSAVAREAEKLYQRPQDFETIIMPGGELIVLQVNDFIMPAEVMAKVETDLRQEGIVGPEGMPRIEEIRRSLVIKRFKLDPTVEHQVIDRGRPVSPGAIEGALIFDPREAVRAKRRGKQVILLAMAPDERALNMILKREIDGFAATYHSVHDEVAARANHLPAVMGLKGPSRPVREGDRVILDGDSGLLLTSDHENILVDNGHEIWAPYRIDGEKLFKAVRRRLEGLDYEALLAQHSLYVGRSKKIDMIKGDWHNNQKKTRIELVTHFVHLMVQEKGRTLGKSELQVNLDVALADGTFERVPGLEKSDFNLKRAGDRLLIVTGAMDDNEAYDSLGGVLTIGITDVAPIVAFLQARGLAVVRHVTKSKPSQHTQEIWEYGIKFLPAILPAVAEALAEYREKIPEISGRQPR